MNLSIQPVTNNNFEYVEYLEMKSAVDVVMVKIVERSSVTVDSFPGCNSGQRYGACTSHGGPFHQSSTCINSFGNMPLDATSAGLELVGT